MKVCAQCNKQFPDNTRFCPECGETLRSSASSQGAPPGNGRTEQNDLIGRNFFGEYTIAQQLGEGGMGAVYLAEQDSIDQKIALKVLHAESAESDEIIQRFHREAKVISKISHPNIVRVFIFGRTDDDLLYLAMEHIDGVELREQLSGQPIDELTAIKIMKQICSALAEAHDLGIIHRDLKPENILLTEHRGDENYVKILDFGIAKIKHPDGQQQGPQLTQAGIVYGTPEYLSPEQAQAHDLDNRTDIYALGCMLFEMMTGRVPFQANSSVEILKKKVFEEPPKPSDFAQVAPTMERIIMKAMEQDREDRFPDALDMFDALDARENELKSERHLDRSDTYFPGSELTGVHRAVSEEEQAAQAAAADGAPPAGGDAFMEDDTVSMDAPNVGQSGPHQNPTNQNPGNPGHAPGGQGARQNQRNQRQAGAQQARQAPARQQPRQQTGTTGTGATGAQGGAPTNQRQNQPPSTASQQVPADASNQQQFVRYLLIGAVILLALAVLALGVYLLWMVFG